ncbi:sigma-70 region 2 [Fructobacillus pseudoficulneus]|uniref:Sigma-70 region 2 n=1 Tax=Fructobacillus pseudoficulneus TaxID=220714 RepID=A0A3F3GSF0_9LACO|nr:type II-A CRISPR-associated protein Csn2 [Fructobacillus pseudoficulneus]GAP02516.1 sigma-70 region 2 [Fructobacillus pseudoficulneus]SEH37361.1 CRISPR type II-A/NMEMI-associated protein Csn2 [Fructobacillus pseudoficulneus]
MSIGQINIENVGIIQIEEGLNSISIEVPELYGRVVNTIQLGIDDLIVYSEDHKTKQLNKVGIFLGDPVSGDNIRDAYSKFVFSILSHSISEEGMEQLYNLNIEMQSVINQEIIENNLPLTVESGWELERLLKSQKIELDNPHENRISGKIENVIHTMGMLNEKRYLILTNLPLYCDMSELNLLHQCLLAEGINLISLNLLRGNTITDEKFKVSHIDQDFVLFTQ